VAMTATAFNACVARSSAPSPAQAVPDCILGSRP
jgi:hypothetical protein